MFKSTLDQSGNGKIVIPINDVISKNKTLWIYSCSCQHLCSLAILFKLPSQNIAVVNHQSLVFNILNLHP